MGGGGGRMARSGEDEGGRYKSGHGSRRFRGRMDLSCSTVSRVGNIIAPTWSNVLGDIVRYSSRTMSETRSGECMSPVNPN